MAEMNEFKLRREKMPEIDRVMTRGGDKGETSLVDGSRVRKCSQRVHAYGSVDELNSWFVAKSCRMVCRRN